MTTTLAHAPHRIVGEPYDMPRLTRTEIEALIAGRPASTNPRTSGIIDRIVQINTGLAIIDARRDPNREPTEAEVNDYSARQEPLARLHRQIGLYPTTN
jgi:hypothetical protein